MKIQIKHRYNGSILFEHECKNNTIKNSLIQGIKENANLVRANLEGANLVRANLEGANLVRANIPIFSKWPASIIDNKIIRIGCKEKTISDWDSFFASEEEFDTKRGTAEFKQIEAMYLAHKAYLTHLNN